MVQLELKANINSDTSQVLKEIGGLKDDADTFEERINSLSERGYDIKLELKDGELTLTVDGGN